MALEESGQSVYVGEWETSHQTTSTNSRKKQLWTLIVGWNTPPTLEESDIIHTGRIYVLHLCFPCLAVVGLVNCCIPPYCHLSLGALAARQAVGIGAGNRDDFGVLGRIQQRGGRFVGRLHHVEQMIFDPVDEGRAPDPE